MLKIPTYIQRSKIDGIGLFCQKAIQKNSLIWEFQPHLPNTDDRKFLKEAIDSLQSTQEDQYKALIHHGFHYQENGIHYYGLCLDQFKYINHSDTPNLRCEKEFTFKVYADQDIEPDAELTINYRDINLDWV